MVAVKFTWNGPRVQRAVKESAQRGVERGLNIVLEEIERLIDSPKSGIKYAWLPRVSSAPFEPPARQSGYHISKYRVRSHIKSGQVKGTIENRTKRAEWLEEGTRKMDPRPVIQIAMDNKYQEIVDAIADEMKRTFG